MKNKILIITRAFPPVSGGGVQRIVKFSVYLQEMGWDVTVCAPLHKNPSWLDETRDKQIKKIKAIRIDEKPYTSSIINKVINKLRFYDYYYHWAKSVINYFKDNFEYNYVITSGPPHSVHKIGLELKNKYNFYWISDFRDPFTLAAFYKPVSLFHNIFQKQFEQKIYNESDFIITNTIFNEKETKSNFKINQASKITTIYNGYDFEDLKIKGEPIDFPTNKINFIYLGGMRGDNVDGYFYRLLKIARDKEPDIIQNIMINLIGDLSRSGDLIKRLKIDDLFIFHNAVSYDSVGDYIQNSDGCLTWQSPDKGYRGTIAGKVFDYFGLKKPIFSLGQMEGELAIMINNHKIGIHTDANNLDKASNDFIYFIKNLKEFKLSYKNMSTEYFESFNRKNQAMQLNQILTNLLKDN